MFIGTYDIVLNENSRIIMPSDFRKNTSKDILKGDFYITPHNGHLIIRPKEAWINHIHSIQTDSELSRPDKYKFERYIYNNSFLIRLDSQYRIVLTKDIRGKIDFKKTSRKQNVKIAGCGEYFEIWPVGLFREDQNISELSQLIERFEGN